MRDLRDNIKHKNIYIIEVPEGEEGEQGIEAPYKGIMTEHFPNLTKKISIQVQAAQSSKQDKPKHTHTKTHHNSNGQV